MKKTIIILSSVIFLMSCGELNQPSTETPSGTDGNVDTLQHFYDSVEHVQDSLISLDTNKYAERYGKKVN